MTLQEQIMKALHVQPVIDPKVQILSHLFFLHNPLGNQLVYEFQLLDQLQAEHVMLS